jgi:hypothetical protein
MVVQKLSKLDMDMLDCLFDDRFYESILKAHRDASGMYKELYKRKTPWDTVPENNSEYMKLISELHNFLYSYKNQFLAKDEQ